MGEEENCAGRRQSVPYGGKGAISSCLYLFLLVYALEPRLPTWKWQEHFEFPVEVLGLESLGEQPTGSLPFEKGLEANLTADEAMSILLPS